jgi:hypothetical protein
MTKMLPNRQQWFKQSFCCFDTKGAVLLNRLHRFSPSRLLHNESGNELDLWHAYRDWKRRP